MSKAMSITTHRHYQEVFQITLYLVGGLQQCKL